MGGIFSSEREKFYRTNRLLEHFEKDKEYQEHIKRKREKRRVQLNKKRYSCFFKAACGFYCFIILLTLWQVFFHTVPYKTEEDKRLTSHQVIFRRCDVDIDLVAPPYVDIEFLEEFLASDPIFPEVHVHRLRTIRNICEAIRGTLVSTVVVVIGTINPIARLKQHALVAGVTEEEALIDMDMDLECLSMSSEGNTRNCILQECENRRHLVYWGLSKTLAVTTDSRYTYVHIPGENRVEQLLNFIKEQVCGIEPAPAPPYQDFREVEEYNSAEGNTKMLYQGFFPLDAEFEHKLKLLYDIHKK